MPRRQDSDKPRILTFDFDAAADPAPPARASDSERETFLEQLRAGFSYENPRRTRSLLQLFDAFLRAAQRNASGFLELEATEQWFAAAAGMHRNTASSRLNDLQTMQVFGVRGVEATNKRPCRTLRYFLREDVLSGRCPGDAPRQRSLEELGAPTSDLARQLSALSPGSPNPALTGDPTWRAKFPSESELKEGISEGYASEVSKTGGGQRRASPGLWGFSLEEEDLANGPRMLEFFEVALRHGDGCVEDSEQCRLNFLAFAHMKHRQWKRNQRIPAKRHSSGVKLFLHNLRQPDDYEKEWDDHRTSKLDEDWARKQLRPARAAATPMAAMQLAASMSAIDAPKSPGFSDAPKSPGFSQEFRARMRRPAKSGEEEGGPQTRVIDENFAMSAPQGGPGQ